jgi:hypothetical protein
MAASIKPEERQSRTDKNEAKVKLVANGYVVKTDKWYVFEFWPEAVTHLEAHFAKVKAQDRERKNGV